MTTGGLELGGLCAGGLELGGLCAGGLELGGLCAGAAGSCDGLAGGFRTRDWRMDD